MSSKYGWRPGFPNRGVSAAAAYRVIESVRKPDGIDAADVVRVARPKSSPIHGLFTWDDGEAAEKWRLAEASRIVRFVVVERGPDVEPTRAFVSACADDVEDQIDGRFRYHPTDRAMSDPVLSEKILRRALQDLVAWKSRYAELKAAADLVEDVSRVIQRHTPKARRKAS